MRMTLIMVLLLFIAACSTTKIHVYTSGVDQHTQRQLLQSLNTAGFKAHQQTTPMQQLKEGTYIIYTPNARSTQINQTIENILVSLNLPAPESRLFSLGEGISAHRYTKGNIGLYVISSQNQSADESAKKEKTDSILDWELGSVDCKKSYILDFMRDGNSIFSQLEDGSELATLSWTIENNQLILSKLFKRYIYDISEEQQTITPKNKYPEPFGCRYKSNIDSVVHDKKYLEQK
jgi:hypothetical protein